MANVDLQLNAINALVHIKSAIKNDQQYSSANPAIINFIETLYLHLADTLRQDAPLAFADLEKKTLSDENISDQQDDKTIKVSFLQDIISGLDFKSFSFNEDPEKEELHIIINLLKQKRKPAQDETYLPNLMAEDKEEQISSDSKISLNLEKDQEIVTVPDNAEDKIPEVVAGTEKEFTSINAMHGAIETVPSDEKDQEIVTASDNAEDKIPEDVASTEKEFTSINAMDGAIETVPSDEKNQEIVAVTDNAEDKIPEGVASMEKVFTRMNAMDGAIESMPSEEKMNMLTKLSVQSAQWLETENDSTPEYKELCRRLEALVQEFISNGYFAEAASIINIFSKINNGLLQKDDEIKEISLKILRNLASTNNFNLLFKEINTDEHHKKNDATQILVGFGSIIIDKLLDGLKKDSDSKARISLIHIIEEMGPEVIPAVKSSISMTTPWYYLRNVAYVLGRIGNETSVDVLKPLLLHTEKRVRKEAFKSIVQTGGSMRGSLLLSMLFLVDQELRVDIIEVLGKIKYKPAVTDLHNMLKSSSTMAKSDQISVPEKICKALGAIGSPEAIKVLTAIVQSKSILGIGSYSKEVKYAAERTLAYIKRKQEE
ncbi:MAG TPA: HEAT repeat domain-containing protein [Smithella sp.]|nr:HEAT repeat domain-containing protein [Smithella sp.]